MHADELSEGKWLYKPSPVWRKRYVRDSTSVRSNQGAARVPSGPQDLPRGAILAAVSFWVTFKPKDHRQRGAANIIKATVIGNNFKIPKPLISTWEPYKN